METRLDLVFAVAMHEVMHQMWKVLTERARPMDNAETSAYRGQTEEAVCNGFATYMLASRFYGLPIMHEVRDEDGTLSGLALMEAIADGRYADHCIRSGKITVSSDTMRKRGVRRSPPPAPPRKPTKMETIRKVADRHAIFAIPATIPVGIALRHAIGH